MGQYRCEGRERVKNAPWLKLLRLHWVCSVSWRWPQANLHHPVGRAAASPCEVNRLATADNDRPVEATHPPACECLTRHAVAAICPLTQALQRSAQGGLDPGSSRGDLAPSPGTGTQSRIAERRDESTAPHGIGPRKTRPVAAGIHGYLHSRFRR